MTIRTLSDYCKERFGTKVYRLSLSTGCSCPNRDGKAGRGGCSFCSEGGSGEFATKVKDIAYFQSFTNTYGDVARLEKEYKANPFKLLSLEEYTEILVNCLKILPETTVIHRMTGDGDKRLLVEPLWSANKKVVLNTINKAIREAERE